MSGGWRKHEVNFHLGQEGSAASFRVRTICDYFNSALMGRVFTATSPRHVKALWNRGGAAGRRWRRVVSGAILGYVSGRKGEDIP